MTDEPQFKPGWLQDQVDKSVATLNSLPEDLRDSLTQPGASPTSASSGAPATGTEPQISAQMREAFVLARDQWDVHGVHYSPVAAGLAAVYPLIEAEVRERVKAEAIPADCVACAECGHPASVKNAQGDDGSRLCRTCEASYL